MTQAYETFIDERAITPHEKQEAKPYSLVKYKPKPLHAKMYNLYQKIASELDHKANPVVEFTGSKYNEGTTTFIREFAHFLTLQMKKTVLIFESNKSHGRRKDTYEEYIKNGWDDILSNNKPYWNAVNQIGQSSLYICSTKSNPKHAIYLDKSIVEDFLMDIKGSFDIVLIDTPPLTSHENIYDLSKVIDGSLLIVECNKTKAEIVKQSIQHLQNSRSMFLGSILNKRVYPIPNLLYKLFG